MNKKTIFSFALALFSIGSFAESRNIVTDSLNFAKMASRSVLDIVDGQMSGVLIQKTDGSVNGAVNTYIRGLNTIHGDSQPLYILNGAILTTAATQNLDAFFQYPESAYTAALNELSFINPYDIESIEVIKDISELRQYGALGANGVVILKSKLPVKNGKNFTWHSTLGVAFPDKQGEMFAPAFNHNHSIAFSSSDNTTRYSITGSFRNLSGIAKDTYGNYAGLTANLETRSNKIFWFRMNTLFSYGKQRNQAGTAYVGTASPMLSSRMPELFPQDTPAGWLADYDDLVDNFKGVASAALRINFTRFLYLEAAGGADIQNCNRSIWYGLGTSFGAPSEEFPNGGAASILNSTLFNYNGNLDLTFKRYFNEKHLFSAVLSGDADGNTNIFNTMSGLGFSSHVLRANGLNMVESKKYVHKFSRSTYEIGAQLALTYDYDRIVGADAALKLNWRPKYDDSRPGFFPTANVYVDFARLFLRDNTAVNKLKLTAGYGIGGRDQYVPYELTSNYLAGGYPSIDASVAPYFDGLNRLRSTEFTVGIEGTFINNSIDFALKYYDKTTDDGYSMYCFGVYSPVYKLWTWGERTDVFSRSSTLTNKGFELDINAVAINTSRLLWRIYFNGAYNVNQLLSISEDDFHGKKIGDGTFVTANVLGKSISSLYGYQENTRNDGLAYLDITRDGKITEADKVVLGNTIPKFTGALGSVLSWNGFDFDILFKGVAGQNIANLNSMIADCSSDFSSKYVESGDYFSLNRVGVSYNIKTGWKWLKGLKVNASGLNLVVISKYSGWNPDVNSFGNSTMSYGIDCGSYPFARTVMVGFSAIF